MIPVLLIALLLQVAPVLGSLPRQALPAKGCAAYLWNATSRDFIAAVNAEPASLRVTLDGKVVDIARASQEGTGDYGFAAVTRYAVGDLSATLDMQIARRGDLQSGAAVPTGTLTIARTGQDSVVVPVAGLIGCA